MKFLNHQKVNISYFNFELSKFLQSLEVFEYIDPETKSMLIRDYKVIILKRIIKNEVLKF